jgi:hypothetical protein
MYPGSRLQTLVALDPNQVAVVKKDIWMTSRRTGETIGIVLCVPWSFKQTSAYSLSTANVQF